MKKQDKIIINNEVIYVNKKSEKIYDNIKLYDFNIRYEKFGFSINYIIVPLLFLFLIFYIKSYHGDNNKYISNLNFYNQSEYNININDYSIDEIKNIYGDNYLEPYIFHNMKLIKNKN